MRRLAWIVWYILLVALATLGELVNVFIYANRDVFKKANGRVTPSLIVVYLVLFTFAAMKLGKHIRSQPRVSD